MLANGKMEQRGGTDSPVKFVSLKFSACRSTFRCWSVCQCLRGRLFRSRTKDELFLASRIDMEYPGSIVYRVVLGKMHSVSPELSIAAAASTIDITV